MLMFRPSGSHGVNLGIRSLHEKALFHSRQTASSRRNESLHVCKHELKQVTIP